MITRGWGLRELRRYMLKLHSQQVDEYVLVNLMHSIDNNKILELNYSQHTHKNTIIMWPDRSVSKCHGGW